MAAAVPYAPFIFINSQDWTAPQLFTLVHELAHIWIAETGISNDLEPDIKNKDKLHPVELLCNLIAANALMPRKYISSLDPLVFQNSKEVYGVAKNFGVSSFALLVRALNLNLISMSKYTPKKGRLI